MSIDVIYSTKKLRKMYSSGYHNKSSKKLEIKTLVCYKVSFIFPIRPHLNLLHQQ